MYCKYFGLAKNPFSLSTSTECIYFSPSHREAAAQILCAVRECKGIVLLTGDPGTGKTTLVHKVLELVRPAGAVTSTILKPMMESAHELLSSVLTGFRVNIRGDWPTMELLGALYGFLEDQLDLGRRAVLTIDEAQHLSHQMLEHLRLISDLEKNGQRMIQLVLSAQPEIGQELSQTSCAALRQRIVARCQVMPLQPSEVWNYLAMRVGQADSDGRMLFQPDAVDIMSSASLGIPRVINVLADNCLIAAYAKGKLSVDKEIAVAVARHFDLNANGANTQQHASIPNDRSPEAWKRLVSERSKFGLPTELQEFANSLDFRRQIA